MMCQKDSSEIIQSSENVSPVRLKLNVNLKMTYPTENICDTIDIEEPVSPPACDPEDGPPLLLSQSIEDIASEVVGENWSLRKTMKMESSVTDIGNLPKTVQKERRISIGSLIPVTVSEISQETVSYPYQSPSTLHMSGGMVSTDMTLHMASVPTSVITTNTYIENKLTQDQGIDNILQYFIQSDNQKVHPPSNSKSIIPSEMFPNLPMDLSITKIPRRSCQRGKEAADIDMKTNGEEQKDTPQTSYGTKRTATNEIKENIKTKRQKKETKSSIESSPIRKAKESKSGSTSTGQDDINCRLILPRNKEENAKIVFNNGMAVEIAREVFNSLDHNLFDKKSDRQTSSKKKVERPEVETKNHRRKKASPRIQPLKPPHNEIPKMKVLDTKKIPKSITDELDKKPKDMPLLETNNNTDEEMNQISTLLPTSTSTNPIPPAIISSNPPSPMKTFKPILPITSTPQQITPPPSPPSSASSPSSPPGLHKLPSIVSKPSYYAKCESRKVLKVK